MPITEAELREKYQYVRTTFFPQWDRKRQWKAQLSGGPFASNGSCESETKTININWETDPKDLVLVLIHEIAHAVARDYHGKKWQARMEKAAKRAEEIGEAAVREYQAQHPDVET